jgi:hypothetical protein
MSKENEKCCNCEYEDICRNKNYAGCKIRKKTLDEVLKTINYGGYGGIVVYSNEIPRHTKVVEINDLMREIEKLKEKYKRKRK